VGRALKPRVKALGNLADSGVGHPDFGLYGDKQAAGQLPERGVVEVKGTAADVAQVARGEQVRRYLTVYRQVLVTNYWDFALVGCEGGRPAVLECYRLAGDEADFWRRAAHPRALARDQGEPFVEYLKRVMLHPTVLSRPRDVAWFLASYARDALARLPDDSPALWDRGPALRDASPALRDASPALRDASPALRDARGPSRAWCAARRGTSLSRMPRSPMLWPPFPPSISLTPKRWPPLPVFCSPKAAW
jgi:hypothetical protein